MNFLLEHEKMKSLQTKGSRNLEMNENNLKKLHVQRVYWKGNNINALSCHDSLLILIPLQRWYGCINKKL
jgi:hypothetical protein